VDRRLREAETRAISLLRAHQAELRSVVGLLLEQETVDGDAVYRVLGMEPPEHRQEPAVLAGLAGHNALAGLRVSGPRWRTSSWS
jgi:hypothetical protein